MRGMLRWTVRACVVAAVLGVGAQRAALAQARGTIVGTVKTEGGQPIPQAQVNVSGRVAPVLTDDNGGFRIVNVPAGPIAVHARRIGYHAGTQVVTVQAGDQVVADFTLAADALKLDEIVVAGTAGDQARRSQPAAVATINLGDSLNNRATNNTVAGALQAQSPSVSVEKSSGTSGTSTQIRIRGLSSISLSNDPLVYVDGVRITSAAGFAFFTGGQAADPLSDIPPGDIQDIQVVKGPAAATLYGADATAGVIAITTRRGRAGTQSFHQSVGVEFNSIDRNFTPRTNYGRCTAGDTANVNSALCGPNNITTPGTPMHIGTLVSDNPLLRENAFRTGQTTNLTWSGRGGGQNYGVYASLASEKENGVFVNNGFSRKNGRVNFDWLAAPTLTLDFGVGVIESNDQLPDNDNNIFGWLGNAQLGSPRTRTLDASGNNGWFGFARDVSAMSAIQRNRLSDHSLGSFTANWNPTPWFRNRLIAGYDWDREEDELFFPKNARNSYSINDGQISQDRASISRYTLDYLGNIENNLTPSVVSNLSFGAQLIETRTEDVSATGEGLVVNSNNVVGAASLTSGAQGYTLLRTAGFLGQWQVGYRNRLFGKLGLRADNASSFGSNSHWVYLPTLGASWVISEEPFWNQSLIPSLRLRASWGSTGRIPGPGAALTTLSSAPYLSGTEQPGAVFNNPGNANLKFEHGTEFETGFDAALFHQAIGIEVTYFDKVSKDLILQQPIPPSLGFTANPFVNIGEMVNKGWEITVHGTPINRRNLTWDFQVGANTLHNEVTDMGAIKPFGTLNRVQVGMQARAWVTHRILNVNDSSGVVTADSALGFAGNILPTFELSLTNYFTVAKNWRLYVLIDTKRGYSVFDNSDFFRETQLVRSNLRLDTTILSRDERLRRYGNPTPGQPAFVDQIGRPLTVNDVQEAYIQSGNFVRLREVSLTWTLPEAVRGLLRSSTASFTVAGQNLGLWSKYQGFDPEVISAATLDAGRQDFFTQPPVRRWIARLNLTY